jgi:polar amino acid transport system substrate-binding protein
MRTVRIMFAFIAMIMMVPTVGLADEITIVADNWCPYNCEPDTKAPGFMIEIAETVFKKAGHTVKYKIVEWDQALEDTQKGKYNAITGAAKTDAEGFVFPQNELGIVVNKFFARKDVAWTYTGVDSLKDVKVGIIKGYEYAQGPDAYFAANMNTQAVYAASGEKPLEDLIEKLEGGDIDVIVEDGQVFSYFFISYGLIDMLEMFPVAGPAGKPDELYIAFSPANPKSREYARILSEGMDSLRKSGELNRILAKYGSRDWK